MPVTPKVRVRISKSYLILISSLPLTISLAVTPHLKIPATVRRRNTAKKDISNRATGKKVVTPTLRMIPMRPRAKRASVVSWVLLVVD